MRQSSHLKAILAVICASASLSAESITGLPTAPVLEIQPSDGYDEERRRLAETLTKVVKLYLDQGISIPGGAACRVIITEEIAGSHCEGLLGLYDRSNRTVQIRKVDASLYSSVGCTCIPDAATAFSIVAAHELSHFMNSVFRPDLHPLLDECIASFVQFAILEERQTECIRALPIGLNITSLSRVTLLQYIDNPAEFQIACYSYLSDRRSVVNRCLHGVPPMVRDPFFGCEP